jgi:hypothetical protein
MKKQPTEAPFILMKATIYQIKFDANKILKMTEDICLPTNFLTSASKEGISCTLAGEIIIYSLPANQFRFKLTIRISGVFICRR